MAKLYYWIAEITDDSPAYSAIGKTKKEVIAKTKTIGESRFLPPVRRVIHYKDAFDLFEWATGEGGGKDCGSLVSPTDES